MPLDFALANRVQETTSTAGTGNYELNGAFGGRAAFADAFDSGGQTYYTCIGTVAGQPATEWGWGILTHGTPDTLSRVPIGTSLGGTAALDWDPGAKVIYQGLPAEMVVYMKPGWLLWPAGDVAYPLPAMDPADGEANSAALNAALAVLPDTGCQIVLPPGDWTVAAGDALETDINLVTSTYDLHLGCHLTRSRTTILGHGSTLKLGAAKTGNDLSRIIGNRSNEPLLVGTKILGLTLDLDGAGNAGTVQARGLVLHNTQDLELDLRIIDTSAAKTGYAVHLYGCDGLATRLRMRDVSGGLHCDYVDNFDIAMDIAGFNEAVDFDKRCSNGRIFATMRDGREGIDFNGGRNVDIDLICEDFTGDSATICRVTGKYNASNMADHLADVNKEWHHPENIRLRAKVKNCGYGGNLCVIGHDWDSTGSKRETGTYPRKIHVDLRGSQVGQVKIFEGEVDLHVDLDDIKVPIAIAQGAIDATGEVDTTSQVVSAAAVASGGSGYAVGDTFRVLGGTYRSPFDGRVTAVAGGVVTGIAIAGAGRYVTLPSNPCATVRTSGVGNDDLTVDLTWDATIFTADVMADADLQLKVGGLLRNCSGVGLNVDEVGSIDVSGLKIVGTNTTTELVVVRALIGAAGTGYAVHDLVHVVGGTYATQAYAEVLKVGGSGEVQEILLREAGDYSAAPPSTASTTTGGAGSGLTLQIRMNGIDEALRITNSVRPTVANIDGLDIDGRFSVTGKGYRGMLLLTGAAGSQMRWGGNNKVRDHQFQPNYVLPATAEIQQAAFQCGNIPAGAGTVIERAFWLAETARVDIIDLLLVTSAAVPNNTTDFVSLLLRNRTEAGGGPNTIFSSASNGASGNFLEAWTPRRLQPSGAALTSDPDAYLLRTNMGYPLIFAAVGFGAGRAINDLLVVVRYIRR